MVARGTGKSAITSAIFLKHSDSNLGAKTCFISDFKGLLPFLYSNDSKPTYILFFMLTDLIHTLKTRELRYIHDSLGARTD